MKHFKSSVKSMHSMSEFIKSYVSVKQGKHASPLHFIIFIDGMAKYLLSNHYGIFIFSIKPVQLCMLLFADDTVIFANTLKKKFKYFWTFLINNPTNKILMYT